MRTVCGSALLAAGSLLAALPSEAQQGAAPQTEASQSLEKTEPTEPTEPEESDEEITPDIEEILVEGARGEALVYEQPLSITHFDASQLEYPALTATSLPGPAGTAISHAKSAGAS